MTETLDAQKLELEEIHERLQSLQQAKDDLETLFTSTSTTLATTQGELEATANELATASAELEQTQAELEVAALERDQTQFISMQQAATEEGLRQQAESLVAVAETTTQHVDGLHAKIGRKSAVEAHNLTASQQLEGNVVAQVEASKHSLRQFEQKQHASLTTSASTINGFADKVANNMSALTASVKSTACLRLEWPLTGLPRWRRPKPS